MRILREGRTRKFLDAVEQRTFSGPHAARRGQPVLYVTERCVFRLTAEGLELVEVAPGVDVERDILARMDFRPILRDPRPMDARLFREAPMELRGDLLALPLADRFILDPQANLFFINFEGLVIRNPEQVRDIDRIVRARLAGAERPYAIVNYDNFALSPELLDAYADMVTGLVADCYSGVTRYTTSGFLRMKLGDALAGRVVAPHVYERADEARAALERMESRLPE